MIHYSMDDHFAILYFPIRRSITVPPSFRRSHSACSFFAKVRIILEAERLRRSRQTGLVDFVRGLVS